ncbi:MAG: response regulator transcription factor [Caldilineaceae bacterium]|nr:response regulator transcription factor [Caldilineaceae bacterium]
MTNIADFKNIDTELDKIRIMIVEDHPLFGQGLRRVLEGEDDLRVIAEVEDGIEAVDAAIREQPDVVLMDINLPGQNGLQATREIKNSTHGSAIGIIILTAYHDDEQLFHALRAGAAAYYPKDVMPSELIPAVRAVAENNYVIGEEVMNRPQVARWMIRQFEELAIFGESPDEMFMPLSPREMEILQYITRGASNKEIAHELGISRQTVKNHMSSILRKLAVNDRTQAAVLALRRGWVRLEDTTAIP